MSYTVLDDYPMHRVDGSCGDLLPHQTDVQSLILCNIHFQEEQRAQSVCLRHCHAEENSVEQESSMRVIFADYGETTFNTS